MTLSVVCPLCEQRATNFVCARCALTTAEERDAARAEVARLTTLLVEARRLVSRYAIGTDPVGNDPRVWCYACNHWVMYLNDHPSTCPIAAFLATTKGGSDAAT